MQGEKILKFSYQKNGENENASLLDAMMIIVESCFVVMYQSRNKFRVTFFYLELHILFIYISRVTYTQNK